MAIPNSVIERKIYILNFCNKISIKFFNKHGWIRSDLCNTVQQIGSFIDGDQLSLGSKFLNINFFFQPGCLSCSLFPIWHLFLYLETVCIGCCGRCFIRSVRHYLNLDRSLLFPLLLSLGRCRFRWWLFRSCLALGLF